MNKELIKIDRNGSKHYRGMIPCDRCGGVGGADAWKYTGWTCYKCGGERMIEATWIERTPEYQAKLDAKREARRKAAEEQFEKEKAERLAKIKAEEERKRAEEERIKAEKAISQYVGTEGEKIQINVVYEFTASFEVRDPFGRPETRYIHSFKDEAGDKLVWKTGTYPAWVFDLEKGDKIEIKGTVKAHSEYREEKQTSLIRCKAV